MLPREDWHTCPCGRTPFVVQRADHAAWAIRCDHCGLTGGPRRTKALAISAWRWAIARRRRAAAVA